MSLHLVMVVGFLPHIGL